MQLYMIFNNGWMQPNLWAMILSLVCRSCFSWGGWCPDVVRGHDELWKTIRGVYGSFQKLLG